MSTLKLASTRSGECTDLCKRISLEPLLEPSNIIPSQQNLEVIGVLNPAFIYLNGKPTLVVRIDERPRAQFEYDRPLPNGHKTLDVAYFLSHEPTQLGICRVSVPTSYDADKESVLPKSARRPRRSTANQALLLCFVSHLRLAHICGSSLLVENGPLVFPFDQFSQFGCEDPRATMLNGIPYLTFSGIGRFGATAWICSLSNTGAVVEKRMLFGPDHKHCSLFPQEVNGKFLLLTRPLTRSTIASESIWLQSSEDLLYWGTPRPVLHPRPSMWDSIRVGPGPSPILLPTGWLLLYYGVDRQQCYHLGAAILDCADPAKVVARSSVPVLSPILPWERNGRRADTIFACGSQLLPGNEIIRIFYGATDMFIGAADLRIKDLEKVLVPTRKSTV